jgi:hypothetical protein
MYPPLGVRLLAMPRKLVGLHRYLFKGVGAFLVLGTFRILLGCRFAGRWMGTDEPFRDPPEKSSRGNPFAKREGTSYSDW